MTVAKIVQAFPSDPSKNYVGYPWTEWMDGQIREIVRGVDFMSEAKNMQSYIRSRASAKNMSAQIVCVGDTITFRIFKRS